MGRIGYIEINIFNRFLILGHLGKIIKEKVSTSYNCLLSPPPAMSLASVDGRESGGTRKTS